MTLKNNLFLWVLLTFFNTQFFKAAQLRVSVKPLGSSPDTETADILILSKDHHEFGNHMPEIIKHMTCMGLVGHRLVWGMIKKKAPDLYPVWQMVKIAKNGFYAGNYFRNGLDDFSKIADHVLVVSELKTTGLTLATANKTEELGEFSPKIVCIMSPQGLIPFLNSLKHLPRSFDASIQIVPSDKDFTDKMKQDLREYVHAEKNKTVNYELIRRFSYPNFRGDKNLLPKDIIYRIQGYLPR